MSITEELKEWASTEVPYKYGHELLAIANRIDAEADDNERFRREAEPFCDRLREAAAGREGVTLFGVDYVALPLDAEGVPWHLGDVTENGNTVRGLGFDQRGWHFVNTVNDIDPSIHRHHHEQTVEDVLREFADRVCNSGHQWGLDAADTIAEYAAKLRLAGDAE